jgi:hypothetical protein
MNEPSNRLNASACLALAFITTFAVIPVLVSATPAEAPDPCGSNATITTPTFTVPAGTTQVLTQNTTIHAAEVRILGTLTTSDSDGTADAPSLCIQAQSLTVLGSICTGSGADGATRLARTRSVGGNGTSGGALTLSFFDSSLLPGGPSLTVLPGATLCTGSGGDGGNAMTGDYIHIFDCLPTVNNGSSQFNPDALEQFVTNTQKLAHDFVDCVSSQGQVCPDGSLNCVCNPLQSCLPTCNQSTFNCIPPPCEDGSLNCVLDKCNPIESCYPTCNQTEQPPCIWDECNPVGSCIPDLPTCQSLVGSSDCIPDLPDPCEPASSSSRGGEGGNAGPLGLNYPAAMPAMNLAAGSILLGRGGNGGNAVTLGAARGFNQATGGHAGSSTFAWNGASTGPLPLPLWAFSTSQGGDGGSAYAGTDCTPDPVCQDIPTYNQLYCVLKTVLDVVCQQFVDNQGMPNNIPPPHDLCVILNAIAQEGGLANATGVNGPGDSDNPSGADPGDAGDSGNPAEQDPQFTWGCHEGFDGGGRGSSGCDASFSCPTVTPAGAGGTGRPGYFGAGAQANATKGGYGLLLGGDGGRASAVGANGGDGGTGGKGGKGGMFAPCGKSDGGPGGKGGVGGPGGGASAYSGAGGGSAVQGGKGGDASVQVGSPGHGGQGGDGGDSGTTTGCQAGDNCLSTFPGSWGCGGHGGTTSATGSAIARPGGPGGVGKGPDGTATPSGPVPDYHSVFGPQGTGSPRPC